MDDDFQKDLTNISKGGSVTTQRLPLRKRKDRGLGLKELRRRARLGLDLWTGERLGRGDELLIGES